ncbi:hypothetical protein [Methanimicrococcus hacksteinii]|uniref:hypothetical protein n=1 Tax=Methanimicrococcus hacksteinii TaxID=3028293 RepID=UPI00298EE2BA|nr:hypothetical protein [Methanimicrococcus sp. At1]
MFQLLFVSVAVCFRCCLFQLLFVSAAVCFRCCLLPLLSASVAVNVFRMHHLIFITSVRYANVGTDYRTVSVAAVTLLFCNNTVADLPACLLPPLLPLSLLPLSLLPLSLLPLSLRSPRAS